MRTPASIAGHPIHPMLVPIAIGCWVLSFAADLICLASGAVQPWQTVAYYAYTTAFSDQNFGVGAALSYIIVLVILVLTFIYLRMLRRSEMSLL